MEEKAVLVASLTEDPAPDGEDIRQLSGQVDVLEVRGDLVEANPRFLREHFTGRLLFTYRSRAEGGRGAVAPRKRIDRILAEAPHYDLVDLESTRDLHSDLLNQIPPENRILSWHGRAPRLTDLRRRFDVMAEQEALLYKLVPLAQQSGEELAPLALLHSLERKDVVTFASGAVGTWTRFLAPYLGAPWVYGSSGNVPAAAGQISVERLRRDFGLPNLPPRQAVFGIVGRPVAHSLSPRIHNAAYRELNLPFLYLPFHVESFADFWMEVVESGSLEVLGFPLGGLSVTSPFKDVALAIAGASSPLANAIDAANTLVSYEGVWEAETTDPDGVVEALLKRGVTLKDRPVAVVGAGGAGRAAAVGLRLAGAQVTLVNRSLEKGQEVADRIRVAFQGLKDFSPGGFEVVVQATAVGGSEEDPPFDIADLSQTVAVVELKYSSGETRLVKSARLRGIQAIGGREVLLFQARRQFQLMTHHAFPMELGAKLLGLDEGKAS